MRRSLKALCSPSGEDLPEGLSADEGESPAGDEADGQEEESAGGVDRALKNGGERHVSPLGLDWTGAQLTVLDGPSRFPGALVKQPLFDLDSA